MSIYIRIRDISASCQEYVAAEGNLIGYLVYRWKQIEARYRAKIFQLHWKNAEGTGPCTRLLIVALIPGDRPWQHSEPPYYCFLPTSEYNQRFYSLQFSPRLPI